MIIKTITIDLASKGVAPVIDVMQGDSLTRGVKIKLYNGNIPYQYLDIANASFSVAFEKPDGVRGWYDTLPNEEPAVSVDVGNPSIVTALFAPAMLEIVGCVKATLVLRDSQNKQLASFPFLVNVYENPAYGNTISNEYYNIKSFDEFYSKLLTSFVSTTVNQEFTNVQSKQARDNIHAPMGGDRNLTFVGIDDSGKQINIFAQNLLWQDGELVGGIISFNADNKPVILNNIKDGEQDNDAATVGQLNSAVYNVGSKLDVLWKLNEGISYDFISDDAAGYAKTVPAGCKYASIESIGGQTEVVGGESVSANVESVKEQGFNWWDETWEIGALNVENGNTVSDTGCFRSKDFIPVLPSTNYYFCVKTETTGQAIRVVYYDKNKAYINSPGSDTNAIKKTPENCFYVKFYSRVSPTVYNGGICINVSNTEQNGTYKPYHAKIYTVPEAVRALTGYGWGSAAAYNSIERTDNGWQYVQRVDLPITETGYTVLAEPIVTDITDLMADFPQSFAVEANGTIIFENAARLSVPNTVKYLRSLKEVSA